MVIFMKISIITATYNSEKTLQACLDSVVHQSAIDSIEHIIVDGRSNDSTLAIATQYPHIAQIVSAKDRGIYHAFNRGVELATGDLVYFLNSDDELYDTEVIANVLTAIKPEDDFYCGTVFCIDPETGESYFKLTPQDDLINYNLPHQGFFCRRELFERFGLFNECLTIAADGYFMKRVILSCKGSFIERPIARFSLQGMSSDASSRAMLLSQYEIIDTLLGLDTKNSQLPEKLSWQTQNGLLLKQLMLNVVKGTLLLQQFAGKRIAIFGARELSQWFYHYFTAQQLQVICFVVSSSENLPVYQDVPVVGLADLYQMQPDIVINCIEGEHEAEVRKSIIECCSECSVISWREFCSC